VFPLEPPSPQDGGVPQDSQEALAVPPQRFRPVAGELAQRVWEVPQDAEALSSQDAEALLSQDAEALSQDAEALSQDAEALSQDADALSQDGDSLEQVEGAPLLQDAEAASLQEKTEVALAVRTGWPQGFRALELETAHRV